MTESRKHARVHREGNRIEVEDLGSSNGSFVNGRRVVADGAITSERPGRPLRGPGYRGSR